MDSDVADGACLNAGKIPGKKIVFFGGKGGVGKTTVAAAVALRLAGQGHSTLLVSTDPAHSVADALEVDLGGDRKTVAQSLDVLEIDPEKETDAYIADVKARVAQTAAPRLVAEVERQIDVSRASPGAEESAVFDRFTRIMMEWGEEYQTIVFDTAPTGHTLRLLSLPELMTAWIAGLIDQREKVNALGRMWRNVAGAAASREVKEDDPVLEVLERRKQRFVFARDLLTDSNRSAFFFVVTPERLPVLETERAIHALDKYKIPVGGVIINRLLPADEPGEFLDRRRALESEMVQRIEASFSRHPIWKIPLRGSDVTGIDALLELAHELADL